MFFFCYIFWHHFWHLIFDRIQKIFKKKEKRKICYVGTEKNEFCLNALKRNVIDYSQIELYSELNQIDNKKFDLIIIDGYDDTMKEIVNFCKKNAIIFIEGDRKGQTETVLQIFPVVADLKNSLY